MLTLVLDGQFYLDPHSTLAEVAAAIRQSDTPLYGIAHVTIIDSVFSARGTYENHKEIYMQTGPLVDCPLVSGSHHAWPADFDINRVINILDVGEVLPPAFGTSVPPTSPRRDLLPDGFINILDVGTTLPPTFGQTCP